MEVHDDLQDQLDQLGAFQSVLEAVEDFLQPFLGITPKELDSQLSPLERARAHMCMAQAVCLLHGSALKLQGQRLEDHPQHKEEERLALYERKVRKALAADELARSRPSVTLNVAAANRFIDAAIPELSREQRQQLKQAGDEANKRRIEQQQQQQQRRQQRRSQQQPQQGASKRAKHEAGEQPNALLAEADEVLAMALSGTTRGAVEGNSAADPLQSAEALEADGKLKVL